MYYVRRDPDGAWRAATDVMVELPITKATADAQCLVFDSGDEFTGIGSVGAKNSADLNRP
jgi:hypothetical protein